VQIGVTRLALREASDSVDDVARARLEAVRAMLHAAPDVPGLPLDRASVPAERGRASPLEAIQPTAHGCAVAIGAKQRGNPIARLEGCANRDQEGTLAATSDRLQIGLLGRETVKGRSRSMPGCRRR